MVCACNLAFAQREAGGNGKSDVVGVAIFNKTDVTVNFELRNRAGGDWVPFSLMSNRSSTYSDTQFVRLQTQQSNGQIKSVEYQVSNSKRYSIEWADDKQCYDLFIMTPRGQ
jgi:hypothetical protein